jgi:hypothetical protein
VGENNGANWTAMNVTNASQRARSLGVPTKVLRGSITHIGCTSRQLVVLTVEQVEAFARTKSMKALRADKARKMDGSI